MMWLGLVGCSPVASTFAGAQPFLPGSLKGDLYGIYNKALEYSGL